MNQSPNHSGMDGDGPPMPQSEQPHHKDDPAGEASEGRRAGSGLPPRPGKASSRAVMAMPLPAFVKKTWDILETAEYHHLISWGDKGDSIVIHQVRRPDLVWTEGSSDRVCRMLLLEGVSECSREGVRPRARRDEAWHARALANAAPGLTPRSLPSSLPRCCPASSSTGT